MYDSNAEELFADKHPYITRYNDLLPVTFTDSEGATFRAKADFYHPPTGCLIEFKSCKLNNRRSKQTALNAVKNRQEYRASKRQQYTLYDDLEMAWNHSFYKHGIVTKQLDAPYIVVFDKPIKQADLKHYLKRGILPLAERDLHQFLCFLAIRQLGFSISLNLSNSYLADKDAPPKLDTVVTFH